MTGSIFTGEQAVFVDVQQELHYQAHYHWEQDLSPRTPVRFLAKPYKPYLVYQPSLNVVSNPKNPCLSGAMMRIL